MMDAPSRLIRAARLVDGTGAQPLADHEIVVVDSAIAAVRPIGSESVRQETPIDEFPGATVLPGLIDSHVHLTFNAAATHEQVRDTLAGETDAQLLTRALANARAHLAGGVTSLRDCGGRGFVTLAARDLAREDPSLPRIAACGPAITTSLGHLYYLGLVAEGEAGVGRAAREVLDRGADFVKICATGGIMTPESDPLAAQYTIAELASAVAAAEARGTLVAAHSLNREGLARCVAAGVRSIEHCLWQTAPGEFAFDPELAAELRARGVVAGLTFAGISQARYRAGRGLPTGEDLGPWAQRLAGRFGAERAMIDAGVRHTVHSDAGVRQTPFGEFWLCLAAMVQELGVTPLAAIHAATAAPAALLGWGDRLGTLAPGRRADILVVHGDPSERIEALASVLAVYRDGIPVSLPAGTAVSGG